MASSWSDGTINTLDISLDEYNPRIPVSEGVTQEEIRKQLLMREDVIELAEKIINQKGLLPGERIIVCVENGKFVVLEGNRRVTACQLLLNRSLIPDDFSTKFPECYDENVLENIGIIKADIAPNRDAAEPVITQRHTERGIKSWSLLANIRRIQRLTEDGRSLDETLKVHGLKKETYKTYLRQLELLKLVQELPGWTPTEKDHLLNFEGKLSPFTTFFSREGVLKKLGMSFDENERPISTLPVGEFNKYIKFIAICFLFNEKGKKKAKANSRTLPETIFEWMGESLEEPLSNEVSENGEFTGQSDQEVMKKEQTKSNLSENDVNKNENNDIDGGGDKILISSTKPQEQKDNNNNPKYEPIPKASKFFENLSCYIEDEYLISLTKEMNRISYKLYPIAATMLLRAMLEATLGYQLIKKGIWQELIKKKQGGDLGLNQLIRYCVDKSNNVFIERRASDILRVFDNNYKDYLDFVVHGKWAAADAGILEQMASMIRPLFEYILSDERNKI